MIDSKERPEDEDIAEFWRKVLRQEEDAAYSMCRAELLRDPVTYEIHETVWHIRHQELLRAPGDDRSENGVFRVDPDR